MSLKKSKISSPRIKVIQKLYSSLINPNNQVDYPKSKYKRFIKDIVKGTLERSELLEETISSHLRDDINLKKTDKLLKIFIFAAVFELLYKHNNPKKVIISEYLKTSQFFLEKAQIKYLNAILDKLSNLIRKN